MKNVHLKNLEKKLWLKYPVNVQNISMNKNKQKKHHISVLFRTQIFKTAHLP